jgi:NADP-dependent 3-hydroxy acid dehydrogenase YdfG
MPQLVWFITGCSSGFGECLVLQALSRGDHVIATARKLECIKHLEQAGAVISQLDVTDAQQTLYETATKAIAIYGRIDVLVNNAAYVMGGAWEDLG